MQHRISTSLAIAVLSSVGLAQTYITSPLGLENQDGSNNASLGGYPSGHYQYFDGDVRGNAMTLKGIAYRHDNLVYNSTSQGQGRSFTNVTLDVSHCDMNSLKSTFTQNPTTTPTRVFNNSVSWPTQSGKPKSLPADFSIGFPFASNWNYSGNADICMDFVFTGGTLANNASWGTSTWSYYYVDGENPSAYNYVKSIEFGYSSTAGGCDDRNSTNTYGAGISSDIYYYSPTYSNANYAGNLVFRQTGNYFGPNAVCLTTVGLQSIRQGWDFPGVNCQKSYLDPRFIVLTITQSASNTGSLPQISVGGTYGIPAPPGISGIEIATQTAWQDTANFRMLLSSAASLIVPAAPKAVRKQLVYSSNVNATTGSGPTTSNANMVLRYTK
ncbi:MAG: hypothetical protein KDC87_01110 [Planctomycetes bacterium]|nr:hypothetical protein [Planctomycetota bacterium]